METVLAIEAQRMKIQEQLDTAKKQAERNKVGQFATPPSLALDIIKYAKSLLALDAQIRFLDPAFGTGAFFSALLQIFSQEQIADATGYEIDPIHARAATELWKSKPLHLCSSDFTRAEPPEEADKKANLLICNPPYTRHHYLSREEKRRLQAMSMQTTGIQISQLAGLYCHFLLIAHKWMAEDGLAGWLIPAEVMTVNYGQQIKKYLLNDVTLLRIHCFHPNDLQFHNALVSSCVIWFKKTPPPANHSVELTYGGSLIAPSTTEYISRDKLHNEPKWAKFLIQSKTEYEQNILLEHHIEKERKSILLADLFEVKRGLATGANKFFLLTRQQILQYHLPMECFKPILPGPRYLSHEEIYADEFGNPILEKKLFLLDCALTEEEIKARYPSLWQYLKVGMDNGVNQGFLCSHRKPWYSQEHRLPPLFLCTYMGRQGIRSDKPFRFILNHSKATAANVYLLLYPKSPLQNLFEEKPDMARLVWRRLNSLSSKALINEGRVYGDGLYKLEPRELARLPVNAIIDDLDELKPIWS